MVATDDAPLEGLFKALFETDVSQCPESALEAAIDLAGQLALQWRAELKARTVCRTAKVAEEASPLRSPETLPADHLPGPVCMTLAKKLYGGLDAVSTRSALGMLPAEDHLASYTNVPTAFLHVLMQQLQPTFLVEVGSWKGGSALRIADAAVTATPVGSPPPCLLCIDTWLGDGGGWLDRCVGWRAGLLLERGLPRVFWQFVANVRRRANVIFPWPLASLTALRALQHLTIDGAIPEADFVYLDAAHEKGETLIELTRAFDLLRVGGVLVGDDLDWHAVHSDLLLFCASRSADLVPCEEDDLLCTVPQLYAAPEGYWTLDSVPRQFVLRKGRGGVEALRASVEADEDGPEDDREYVPLNDRDRDALKLYEEAVALSEVGRIKEAQGLFKQAAAASGSVAYHFRLEPLSQIVERLSRSEA